MFQKVTKFTYVFTLHLSSLICCQHFFFLFQILIFNMSQSFYTYTTDVQYPFQINFRCVTSSHRIQIYSCLSTNGTVFVSLFFILLDRKPRIKIICVLFIVFLTEINKKKIREIVAKTNKKNIYKSKVSKRLDGVSLLSLDFSCPIRYGRHIAKKKNNEENMKQKEPRL